MRETLTPVRRAISEPMSAGGSSRPRRRLFSLSLACGAGAALIGLAVLAAWALGVRVSLVPGLRPMTPNSALMCALAGFALLLRAPESPERSAVVAGQGLAIAVIWLALHALAHAFRVPPFPFPIPAAPATAGAMLLLGAALLAFDWKTWKGSRPAAGLALAAGSVAAVAALRHLFRYAAPESLEAAAPAPLTLAALFALSLGTLFARPQDGAVMATVTSSEPGGVAARRLLFALAAVVPLAGVVGFGARRGWFEASLSAALVTYFGIASGAAAILATGRRLNRASEARRRSEERARELFDEASDGIFTADLDGRYTDVNAAGCRMLGYAREEIVGRTIQSLIHPQEVPRLERDREDFLRGQSRVSEFTLRRKDGTWLPVEVSAKILPDRRWQGLVRDISERKKAEDSLRQERERVDLALRGADLAAWDWNVKTGDLVCNARYAELRGYRPEELRPHIDSWWAAIHPDDLPRVRIDLHEHFHGRGDYESEHRVRTKSGGWVWLLDRGRIFSRDENGEPLRMAGTELDITARKRAEEELRRLGERDRFRQALEAASSAMVVVDAQGRVAFANGEAELLFGWTREELRGQSADVLVPAAPWNHVEQRTTRDLSALRKDGSEFPIEISLTPVEDVGETVVVASVTDISRRRAAEAALRESEQRFRLLVQGTRDYAIFMHDTQGRISIWNEGAERILGYRGEEIEGGGYLRFYPPEDVARGKPEADLRAAVERGSFEEEAWRVRKDGSRFWAGVLITPIADPAGRILGYGKVLQDLTEKRKAREALLESDARLRRSVVELETFAYTMAHDLRSPLRALEGYSSVLSDRLGDRVDPESRGMLERMGRAARRLDHLIRDLLAYSAIAREDVALEAVDLDPLVEHVIAHHPDLARARPRIRTPLGRAKAQPSLLLQVLSNLLDNAVKYVPRDRVPDIEVWTERRGDGRVRLAVQDNGPGIPRDAWERVFLPFVRLGGEDESGTGIGLAIVQQAVERMGGRVHLESEPGRGSRFWIDLPEADPC